MGLGLDQAAQGQARLDSTRQQSIAIKHSVKLDFMPFSRDKEWTFNILGLTSFELGIIAEALRTQSCPAMEEDAAKLSHKLYSQWKRQLDRFARSRCISSPSQNPAHSHLAQQFELTKKDEGSANT
jgi:hypothetical protein